MDELENPFSVELLKFEANAMLSKVKFHRALNTVHEMLESHQGNVIPRPTEMIRHKRVPDVDALLEHGEMLDSYKGRVENHPIDYIGNVGMVHLQALPNSGFCGSATLVFIATEEVKNDV